MCHAGGHVGACSCHRPGPAFPGKAPPLPSAPLALQALLLTSRSNQRLWLLATPAACFLALDVGALVEAAQACRGAAHPQGSPAGCQRSEAALLALALLNAAALAAATCCLLAAAAGLGAGGGGDASEPLLGAEAGRKRRRSRGGTRMRLINGTLRYLVPDRLDLKVRCGWHALARNVAHAPPGCGVARPA